MKEKLLKYGSYLLVAILSTAVTLTMVYLEGDLKPSKLKQLENLINLNQQKMTLEEQQKRYREIENMFEK